jgi:hypothetical protein
MIIQFKNRRVSVSVSGSSDDVTIEEAFYDDEGGEELTADEVDEMYSTCGSELYDAWFERQVSIADHLMDMERDR